MRITLPFLSALPLLALLCVSCVNRGYNGATTKHTPGQITRASKGPLWISVEPERAKAIIADQESNPRFPTEFYQQQAPVVQRLQKWVDVIHAELKRRYPEQLSMVPEPQVLIQNQDAINAYVPIFQAYFPLPVAHLDAPRRLRGTEGAMIIFQPYSGKVITYGTEDALKYSLEFMVPMPRDDGLIKNFVEYYADEQAKGEPSRNLCRISYDGKQIALQGRCTTSGMENFERARRFGVAVTPNVLVIHSSLLRLSGSEEEFMRVICHELGHFYRAHTTTPPSRTSYLYARGPRNSPRAPAVTTDLILLELGAKARALLGLTNSLPVAGATLPSALFYS